MSTSQPVRAAIYARQSVAEEQGLSQQVADLRAEVKRRRWTLDDAHVYVDNAVSGSKARGAGTAWGRMLAAIDAGDVDTVIVSEVSRLGRRTSDVLALREERKVRVISIREAIDTDGGDLALDVVVAVAKAEVKTKAARAARYAADRRAAGHPSPGRVPYGYRWVPVSDRDAKGTRYRVEPDEAEVVKRIFRGFLAGPVHSLGALVDALNAEQVPGPMHKGKAGPWRPSTIRRMLLNPVYAALLPPRAPIGKGGQREHFNVEHVRISDCQPGAWAGIVSVDEVRAARGILKDEKRRTHDGDTRARHLLSGVAICGACGGRVRPTRVNGGIKVRGYRCAGDGCFTRPADDIDRFVMRAVLRAVEHVLTVTAAVPSSEEAEQAKAIRTEIAATRERKDEAIEAIADPTNPATVKTLAVALDSIDKRLAELDAELNALMGKRTARRGGTLPVDARAFLRMFMGQPIERRRAFLREFAAPVIHPVGKGRRVRGLKAIEGTVTFPHWADYTSHVEDEGGEWHEIIVPAPELDALPGNPFRHLYVDLAD